ncbi:MAG: methyltransferase family protein [Candidatus Hodarchaeota archaeon]
MPNDSSSTLPPIRLRYFVPYLLIFVLVPIVTFMVGRYIDRFFWLPRVPPFPINLISGLCIMFCGAAIGVKATRQLRKAGKGLPWGAFEKKAQSSILITTGIYAHCRNPITFGYTLLPLGMGLLFQSLGMAIPFPLIILVIMVIRIKLVEEPHLEERFGEQYREYKRKTPFMVPRVVPLLMGLFTRHRKSPKKNKAVT